MRDRRLRGCLWEAVQRTCVIAPPYCSVPADNDLLVPGPTLASRRRGLKLSPDGGYDPTRAGFHVAYTFRHLPEHFKVTTWPEAQPSL